MISIHPWLRSNYARQSNDALQLELQTVVMEPVVGTRPRQMVVPPGAGIGSGVATPEGALDINDLVFVERPGSAPPAPGYVGRYEPLPLERIDPIRQPPYPSLNTSPSVPQSMPPASKK